jgi:hypothetical protein
MTHWYCPECGATRHRGHWEALPTQKQPSDTSNQEDTMKVRDAGNKLFEVEVTLTLTLEAKDMQEAALIAASNATPRVPEGDVFSQKKSTVTVKDVRDVAAGDKPF